MKTKILLSILFGAMVLVACKKPDESAEPTLPPLTHTGENTFGCYINFPSAGASGEQGGELFVANNGSNMWSIPAVSGSFNETEKVLNIQGSREIGKTEEGSTKADDVRFTVKDLNDVGNYVLDIEIDKYLGYMSYYLGRCRYYHDLNNPGTCEITYLDMTKNIIAGRFQMTLINPDCEGDTLLKITDGRFDFKY
jgi:hypothetical protein